MSHCPSEMCKTIRKMSKKTESELWNIIYKLQTEIKTLKNDLKQAKINLNITTKNLQQSEAEHQKLLTSQSTPFTIRSIATFESPTDEE